MLGEVVTFCPCGRCMLGEVVTFCTRGRCILGEVVTFCPSGRCILGEVVTFCPRGRCILGVFLFPAFTRLGHERQDLLSPCDGMHVCGLDLGLYSHPKQF